MAAHDDDMNRGIRPGRGSDDPAGQIAYLEQEIAVLRRKLADSPRHTRILEERIVELQTNLAGVSAQNERLANTLREARDQIVALKEEVDRLAQPPAGFGVFLTANEDGTADIFTGGRKLRVNVSPSVDLEELRRGQEVMLNEALNVVEAMEYESVGDIVTLKEILEDGERALVQGHTDEERVVRLAEPLLDITIRPGDALLLEPRSGYVYEVVPKSEVEELVLEEVPDIGYEQIGGLGNQIEMIRDAVELPYLYPDLFKEHELRPPKGVLLYGPPGCGKTLIAKAVANSLAKKVAEVTGQAQGKSFFLNIKGPELLNKYVGETERQIRLVFQRAREKASEGTPVIVFFDEMESLFRTRGSGVSSDVENTIVPQLLAEIDGVEGLQNVVVIGASNREDMIDPAILRPGRLDVKIKIERPDAEAAKDIFQKYLTERLPLHGRRRRARRLQGHHRPEHDPDGSGTHVRRIRGKPLPGSHLRQRRQGSPLLQGLQLRRHDREHRRPRQENGDQGLPRQEPEGSPRLPPPPGLRGRVQGERGPAQHHQPGRLGPNLRKEGRTDRLHPYADHRKAGRRHRTLHRHGGEHRTVPVKDRAAAGALSGYPQPTVFRAKAGARQ